MYAAKFKLGWMDLFFEGNTPTEIIKKVESVQDFICLIRMGRSMGTKKEQKEIDKLELFLEKYYSNELTMEDIKSLDIKLSAGALKCVGIAIDEQESEKLRDK